MRGVPLSFLRDANIVSYFEYFCVLLSHRFPSFIKAYLHLVKFALSGSPVAFIFSLYYIHCWRSNKEASCPTPANVRLVMIHNKFKLFSVITHFLKSINSRITTPVCRTLPRELGKF